MQQSLVLTQCHRMVLEGPQRRHNTNSDIASSPGRLELFWVFLKVLNGPTHGLLQRVMEHPHFLCPWNTSLFPSSPWLLICSQLILSFKARASEIFQKLTSGFLPLSFWIAGQTETAVENSSWFPIKWPLGWGAWAGLCLFVPGSAHTRTLGNPGHKSARYYY